MTILEKTAYIKGLFEGLELDKKDSAEAKVIKADGSVDSITLYVKGLTEDEKQIILDGCLMNYYKANAN